MAHRLWQLARLFLKLGTISFGGPAVYIAAMQREATERRDWLSREHFLDLLGVTYLLPGPNAIQMANHVGYHRAGVLGCLVAGTAFTLPGAVLAALLAWGYESAQQMPEVTSFFVGIKPVVLGLIFAALCQLGKSSLRTWQLAAIGAGVVAASLAGCDAFLTLLTGGLIGAVFLRWSRPRDGTNAKTTTGTLTAATVVGSASGAKAAWTAVAAASAAPAAAAAAISLWKLALFFLKVGAVLFGSGYVLLAYLKGGLVTDYGWLTEQQLLDAIAIGQITPGPLVSTVSFIGYLLLGVPGAAVATAAILLPSFVIVVAVNPWVPRLRRSRWAGRFLDAVTAASIGLIAAVTVMLGRLTLLDWPSWLLAVAAAVLSLCWKVAPLWLVLAGAIAGRALS